MDDAGDVRQRRRHQGAVARRERVHALAGSAPRRASVLCVCSTPFGIGGGAGGVHQQQQRVGVDARARRRGCGARSEQRVEAGCVPGGGARRARPAPRAAPAARRAAPAISAGWSQPRNDAGDDQHRGARLAQGEAQLALAEDRQQRIDDGADARRGEEHDRRLPPVGQLVGDDVARPRRRAPSRPRAARGRQPVPVGEAQPALAVDQRARASPRAAQVRGEALAQRRRRPSSPAGDDGGAASVGRSAVGRSGIVASSCGRFCVLRGQTVAFRVPQRSARARPLSSVEVGPAPAVTLTRLNQTTYKPRPFSFRIQISARCACKSGVGAGVQPCLSPSPRCR